MSKTSRKIYRAQLFGGCAGSPLMKDLGAGPKLTAEIRKFMNDAKTGPSGARKHMSPTTNLPGQAAFASVGKPQSFTQRSCTQFFGQLFQLVERGSKSLPGGGHKLSRHDLFHGHLAVDQNQLVVIFHAKEYPSDMPGAGLQIAGSPFASTHKSFRFRNVIWFWPANRIYAVDMNSGSEVYKKWFKDYIDETFPSALLSPVHQMQLRALTLPETDLDRVIGDVFYIAEAPGPAHEHHVFVGNLRS